MKKFLVLLLGMAVAVSASAGINKSPLQKKVTDAPKAKIEKVTRANGLVAPSTNIQFNGWDKFASHVLRSDQAITWDFEDEGQFAEFQALDADGDGFNWKYFNNEGLTSGIMTAHGGYGLVASASYDKDSSTPLTPNNWLVSPEVTLGGALTFWAVGQDDSYAEEVFAVYVCVGTPSSTADFVKVSPDFTATGSYVQYEIDLSAYQGQVGHFAIRHYNVTDMFWLNIDDITLDVASIVLPYPAVPEIEVTPAATSALVEWAADENADGYNLRWRPWTDMSGNPHEWTFSVANLDEELDGWWTYDMDGDGQGWGLAYTDSEQTDACLISGSYTSSGACSPDNWIGTPDVPLKGELHFTMWGRSASYPEVVQVYAMIGEDMYQLFEDSLITTTTHTVYTVDLSEFEGVEGCIVFRNYSTYDQWSVYIDDVFIGDPNAELIQPAAWNYVYNITDAEFNIEGLTPETKYEVQVQSYNAAHESEWCDIVDFTTLAEIKDVYMLGGNDQGWDPSYGTQFTYDAENGVYTLNYTFPAEFNYFGFTTELAENNDDGGWAYIEPFRFGAIADEGTDYWYSGEEDFVSLTWDAYHAIRIAGGEYNLTVDLNEMKLYIEKVQPDFLRGDADGDNQVTIADVTTLIDYLLSGNAEGVNLAASDCDLDGQISIADVTTLIDYLLSGAW